MLLFKKIRLQSKPKRTNQVELTARFCKPDTTKLRVEQSTYTGYGRCANLKLTEE